MMRKRAGVLLCAICVLCGTYSRADSVPPTFAAVKSRHQSSEAWLLDRHGARLQTVRMDKTVRRLNWVSLDALSPAMQEALIASEDKRFYEHHGVDWQAVLGAAWDHLFTDSNRGASTLSMQLAAMLDPSLHRGSDGRSMAQKWKQMRAAGELEKSWSKPQILEAYLNETAFRGELSGIGAASWGLFRKHPSGLNKAESSLLAALLRGPNAPPERIARRACEVAQKLSPPRPACKTVTSLAWSTLVAPPSIPMNDQLAPHLARRLLHRPGESVRTTLDADLQRFAIETLQRQLSDLRDRQVEDGAVVVIDNHSGDVLAYVGSSDTTSDSPEVDDARAPRLPGSTLKPFLYSLAIERRELTAASLLDDSPLSVETPGGLYLPQNYDRDFKGWVSLRTALASSLNVPAVRTLVLMGYEPFHTRLRQLGLSTLTRDADFYGYSLALGGGETTLLELTNAYRALANQGRYADVRFLPVAGKPVFHPVILADAAWIVGNILSDPEARALTFGLDNALVTHGWAAVKTGTSKDMRDNWAVGFTDRYTVGVWVGNDSGEPMHDVSGISGAAPVWQAIVNHLQQGRPSVAPRKPSRIIARQVTFKPGVEPTRLEYFLPGTEMDIVSLPAGASAQPHISGPGDGAILAMDPDIPAARQIVHFGIRPAASDLQWKINGETVTANADGSLDWPPRPGVYTVELDDSNGVPLDSMRLVVRGRPMPN